jgi:hypothetical protein
MQSSWASSCDGPCCSMQSFERSLEPLVVEPRIFLDVLAQLIEEISGDMRVARESAPCQSRYSWIDAIENIADLFAPTAVDVPDDIPLPITKTQRHTGAGQTGGGRDHPLDPAPLVAPHPSQSGGNFGGR